MAGFYVDVPSRRMPYDADGTVGLWIPDNSPVTEISAVNMTELNDEDGVNINLTADNVVGYIAHIFPELREFAGYFIAKHTGGHGGFGELETSPDTTNGIDGTWTQRSADINDRILVIPDYRTFITSFAVAAQRGVRVRKNSIAGGNDEFMQAIHIYGEISAGETPDRLLWIDNDDDLEFSKPQDYGDVPRGSASDHIVYLKNNSAGLTASTVQITAEALFLLSGAWYTFNDGTGFSATKALAAAIGPGANSVDITIRRIIPDAEVLGLHAARAFVNVGTWA